MKKWNILLMILTATPMLAVASSGMPRVWVYENPEGNYVVMRSKKAERNDNDGDGKGSIKSQLYIHKEMSGSFDRKPELVTSATCIFISNPKERIECSTSSGPFSGAKFEVIERNRADKNTIRISKKYLADFKRAGKHLAPFGVYSYSVFQCVDGCDGISTPNLMVEMVLMGD
ncbi:MAG: hypothetical protein IPF44_16145 [Betaproteobacteria bacterium]|nr:hypothetical protein [Betaproteobacteria bacterium]